MENLLSLHVDEAAFLAADPCITEERWYEDFERSPVEVHSGPLIPVPGVPDSQAMQISLALIPSVVGRVDDAEQTDHSDGYRRGDAALASAP